MIMTLKGEKINFDPKDVQIAKSIVSTFLLETRKSCYDNDRPSLFITTLLMMHLISQDALEKFDAKDLKRVMGAITK